MNSWRLINQNNQVVVSAPLLTVSNGFHQHLMNSFVFNLSLNKLFIITFIFVFCLFRFLLIIVIISLSVNEIIFRGSSCLLSLTVNFLTVSNL